MGQILLPIHLCYVAFMCMKKVYKVHAKVSHWDTAPVLPETPEYEHPAFTFIT